MKQFAGYTWIAGAGLVALLALVSPVMAQEYAPVEIADLKDSPQRFWAKGIVFRDTLAEAPGRRTVKVDGRVVTRFRTEGLGEIYASPEVLEPLAALAPGVEALFSGTVSQRGRDYLVIVQRVAEAMTDGAAIPAKLEDIQRTGSTNEYNYIFEVLDTVLADARKQLFAHSTSQDQALGDLLRPGSPGRDKVANSVRAALRNLEDNAKIPAQEFLVSLMISMLALQEGYVETAAPVYEPMQDGEAMLEYMPLETGSASDATDAIDAPVTREEWDLVPVPEPVSEPEAEPVLDVEPEAMPSGEPLMPVDELDAMTEEMEFPTGAEELEPVADVTEAAAVVEEAGLPPVTGGIEEIDLMAADDAFWGVESPPVAEPVMEEVAAPVAVETPAEAVEEPEAVAPVVAPEVDSPVEVEREVVVPAAPAEDEKPKKKPKKKKKKEDAPPPPPPDEATSDEAAPVEEEAPVADEVIEPAATPVEPEEASPGQSEEAADSEPDVDYGQPLRLR
jgi:hypothetical protein